VLLRPSQDSNRYRAIVPLTGSTSYRPNETLMLSDTSLYSSGVPLNFSPDENFKRSVRQIRRES
jgi:hypothetical protein